MLMFFLSKLPQHTENNLRLKSWAKFLSSPFYARFLKIKTDHRKKNTQNGCFL
jgi:hypothetical protein